jgi:hypothetical protein
MDSFIQVEIMRVAAGGISWKVGCKVIIMMWNFRVIGGGKSNLDSLSLRT